MCIPHDDWGYDGGSGDGILGTVGMGGTILGGMEKEVI